MTDQTAVWIDGDPLMEAIAAAVWEKCGRSDSGMCVEDDPRNIAVAAYAAVLPVPADRAPTLRELEQQQRPNTPPSRPDASPTAPPVKQRADCTELEWAVQERARFERLYTRETVRADLAEQRAERAERIQENADFHLGQEMGRRQLAEKENAQLRAGLAATCICGHTEAQHFEDACLVCNCCDYLVPETAREVIARWRKAALQARADRAAVLTAAERAMLTYALDQAQERIWSEDGFTDEDQAAVTSLRRMADETQQPETRQSCACGQDGCEYCDVDVADEEQPAATCTNCRGTGLDPRYSTGEYDCPDCPPANEPAAVQQPKEA